MIPDAECASRPVIWNQNQLDLEAEMCKTDQISKLFAREAHSNFAGPAQVPAPEAIAQLSDLWAPPLTLPAHHAIIKQFRTGNFRAYSLVEGSVQLWNRGMIAGS
jgi:hypothetical protein